jgi:hypothetical protein
MSRITKHLVGLAAALGITLVVFGFFFLIVSQLPQPKPPPNEVIVNIYPSQPAPKP